MQMVVIVLVAGCASIVPPTPTPTRSLTGPTLAPTEPAIPRPPTEFPGSFEDSFGSSDPTAAALPNDLELPPLVVESGDNSRTVAITLSTETVEGYLYAGVAERSPGVLLLAGDRTVWGGLPALLEQNGFVVLSVNMPQLADTPEFRTVIASFSEFAQGDASLLDASRIAVIGERTAADFALRGCSQDLRCDALVLISPQDGTGAIATLGQYGNRPLLVSASRDEPASFALAENIAATAQGESLMQPFNSEGSGAAIVQNRPDFADLIVSWLDVTLR